MSNELSAEECDRLLVLEAEAESLTVVGEAWPDATINVKSLADTQGLPDHISRENIQLLLCELPVKTSAGLDIVQEIRRVHPSLPILAVLPEPDLDLTLRAFRSGIDDVLIRPFDQASLTDAWQRLAGRRQSLALQETIQQSAKRSLDDLILLKVVGETMRSAGTLQNLLDQVVDLIQSAMDVGIVSLMLVDDEGSLKIRSSRGLPEDVRHKVTIAPGEGVSGYVMEHGEPVLIDDLSTDGRFPPRGGVVRYRTGSLLSVPIQYQQMTMGVLNVNNKCNGEAFSRADQELLLMIAHQTALAIENTKLVSRLREKSLEIEHAHEDLMKLHQDRTRFVCNLSHELKTPLTSVLGFADLLHNFFDQVDESQVREYIDSIYSEGKHLEKLLTGMLRLFSIDSGSENWDWGALPVDNILGSALLFHENRIDAQELDLNVELPKDLMNVWGDEEKLQLLFDALIDNAIKFNRKGGQISISGGNLTLHGEPLVYLRFVNDGQTVQEEDAENIFQGYSQLGDLNVGKPSGVGIGLATCRAILRQMNGEIFLEPNEDGAEGTAIALLMPTRETELKNG